MSGCEGYMLSESPPDEMTIPHSTSTVTLQLPLPVSSRGVQTRPAPVNQSAGS